MMWGALATLAAPIVFPFVSRATQKRARREIVIVHEKTRPAPLWPWVVAAGVLGLVVAREVAQ
jgi:hypothetical protein